MPLVAKIQKNRTMCYNQIMHKRSGDTLIEVTLAVGIFSLVAIAVVAVVNGSTSGAQTALETTLAREEIDTQAEALRFIQSSYINSNTIGETTDESNPEFKFKMLWEEITKLAKKPTSINASGDLTYQPKTCQELYSVVDGGDGSNQIQREGAFVINPQKLGIDIKTTDWKKEVIISTKTKTNLQKFSVASTYPHIVYGSGAAESLADNTSDQSIYKVEGLYVIAVEGPQTTVVTNNNGTIDNKKVAAYYDFYIRSCWYESGSNQPSTISTLMRLYNPDVVKLYPKSD